ncbi:MAG: AraC family transcriptional regulator [Oscillospiraceae bacterium]|nr:AraC family transcriptional regulator [Oscillospiraceae bacterium]
MIKHLNGEHETVEYSDNHFIILYDNMEDENYPVHWHNAIEIIMPLQNGFTVCADNTVYDMKERDLVIIPPGKLHSLRSPSNGRRLIFQCDNSALEEIPALRQITRIFSSVIFINSSTNGDLKVIAKKTMLDILDEYFSDSELSETKIYLKLLELLLKVRENQMNEYKNMLKCTPEKLVEYNEKFTAVLKYIDSNYMYDITLDKLAAIAGYSKYHFSRIFRQYSTVSYIQYINTKRTKAAEALLLNPDIPITEVAMRSGFSSITSFNRIFKEIKHCTPSDFKRLYKSAYTKSNDE